MPGNIVVPRIETAQEATRLTVLEIDRILFWDANNCPQRYYHLSQSTDTSEVYTEGVQKAEWCG